MAPKKKKIAKKSPEKSENELEAKHRRSLLDVAALQECIALQSESVIKVQSDRSDLQRRIKDLEWKLQRESQDHRDVNCDLSRQYKTMQGELSSKLRRSEVEVGRLKEELAACQDELRRERRRREELQEEKEAAVTDLRRKLSAMETEYEKLLHETLDSLASRLRVARRGRRDQSAALHPNHKELLCEFGLSAADGEASHQ